jgi:hypothetical protein
VNAMKKNFPNKGEIEELILPIPRKDEPEYLVTKLREEFELSLKN